MIRILTGLGVAVALALIFACGGSSPTEPTSPFSSSGPPGEPTELDWAQLGARLGGIAAAAIQQAFTPSGGTAMLTPAASAAGRTSLDGGLVLNAPSDIVTFSSQFRCCGDNSSTHVTVSGEARPDANRSVLVVMSYTSDGPLHWTAANGGTTWSLTLQGSQLSATANLAVSAGTIAPAQEVRLSGPTNYVLPTGESRSGPVNLVLAYQNFEQGTPTATGNIGPVQISGAAMPAVPRPLRCARPQEGCGPLVSGPCPCTNFGICPQYGIQCGQGD